MKNQSIISLSGRICSGKSFAAKQISSTYQLPTASFGGFLRFYCKNKFGSDDREILQNEGARLINTDPEWLLMNTIDHFSNDSKWVILEGVRHLSIFQLIQVNFSKYISIFVDASEETRLSRYLARMENSDLASLREKFSLVDKHPVELETESLREICSHRVNSETQDGPGSLSSLVDFLGQDL